MEEAGACVGCGDGGTGDGTGTVVTETEQVVFSDAADSTGWVQKKRRGLVSHNGKEKQGGERKH